MNGEQNGNHYIIRYENVGMEYDGRPILSGINLRIRAGEVVSLVGPSGSGKSQLLGMLGGYITPTTGRVIVEDEVVTRPSRDRGIVFQRYSSYPFLTAIENVMFGLDLEAWTMLDRLMLKFFGRGKDKLEQFRKRAEDLLLRVGLKERDFGKYPQQLSGGMQQRVAIAQALAMNPKILLMDEPFSGLDGGTKKDLYVLLLQLWEEHKMTILYIGHDREEAAYLGTRIVIISPYYESAEGSSGGSKIVFDSKTPAHVAMSTNHRFTPELNQFVEKIELIGLKPEYKARIDAFNLSHQDSMP